jgi:O-antigen/teichoic acid export membrane protein
MAGESGPLTALGRTRDGARAWLAANSTVLGTTGALAGSTVVTSFLGLVYWSAAARLLPAPTVGLASAAISAMMLLGTIGMMGLGTLMISQLPRRGAERGPLLTTALSVATGASLLLWALVALAATRLGLGDGHAIALVAHPLFGLGVALTSAAQVLDQALIGVLRGKLQLLRNLDFAVVKLVVLVALGAVVASADAIEVIVSWVVGLITSFGLVAVILWRSKTRFLYWPDPRLLRGLSMATAKHHVLNLALYGPRLLLPVVAAVVVSADANAAFYAAWMLVNFAFMIPAHFSTVLHAIGAWDGAALAERLRFSLRMSMLVGLAAGAVLFAAAPLLLHVFGAFYADLATGSLRVLVVVIPAMVLKLHYVAVERVRERVGRAAVFMSGGAILEVALALLGAAHGGILGLSIGFTLAVAVQAALSVPALRAALRSTSLREATA